MELIKLNSHHIRAQSDNVFFSFFCSSTSFHLFFLSADGWMISVGSSHSIQLPLMVLTTTLTVNDSKRPLMPSKLSFCTLILTFPLLLNLFIGCETFSYFVHTTSKNSQYDVCPTKSQHVTQFVNRMWTTNTPKLCYIPFSPN